MGKCTHCGKDAGFLRNVHAECREKNAAGMASLQSTALAAAKGDVDFASAGKKLQDIADASYISGDLIEGFLVQSWERAVEQFLADGLLSAEEEGRLMAFATHFHLSQGVLDRNGAWMRATRAAVLREVMAGELPASGPHRK